MNKAKMIGLSDRLNEIVDEANRHTNGTPGCITWGKAVYAIEALSKEVNSKPVMPKVFDDWYIQYGTIEDFMFSFVDSWKGNELESITQDLFAWLYDKELMINTEKLSRCIEAIQSGDYEVKE